MRRRPRLRLRRRHRASTHRPVRKATNASHIRAGNFANDGAKGAMMKTLFLTIGLVLPSATAGIQEVTRADLQGAVISISSVYQQKIIRNGQPMSVELRTTGTVRVSS